MDSWFQRKWVLRSISMLLALLLWFIVSEPTLPFSLSHASTTVRGVQVEYRYDTESYQLGAAKQNVDLTFTGDKATINRLPYYHVFVDLTKLPAGIYPHVPVQVSGLPKDVKYNVKPSSIPVEMEAKMTKTFPVTVVADGNIAAGFDMSPITSTPRFVQVSGTKREVEKVSNITATINVSGLKRTTRREVPLVVHSKTTSIPVVRLSAATAKLTVAVQSKQPHGPASSLSYRDLPLGISVSNPPPAGYQVKSITANVNTIRVYGAADKLKTFTNYPGVIIDLSKVTEDTTIPADVKIISPAEKVTPNKIEIYVKMVRTPTVEQSE